MANPTVKADVDHAASHAVVTKEPTDQFPKYDVARVFLVEGLDTGVANEAATMLDRAKYVPGVAQLGTLCPGPSGRAGAVAIRQHALQIPDSDNSCYVVVTYANPLPGSPVAFLVSDDTALTVESTQLHPRDKSIMFMTYAAPVGNAAAALAAAQGVGAAAAGGVIGAGGIPPILAPGGTILNNNTQNDPHAKPEQYQATFRYSRPIRKVTITGYVVNANLDVYRNSIGSVNYPAAWLRYPPGYWRFDEFRDDGILFGNIQKVTVSLTSRVNENWMSWEIFNSPDLGRRVTVAARDVATLRNLGYFYGWTTANGIIVAGLYPPGNFGGLFGFGGGAVGNQVPGNAVNAAGDIAAQALAAVAGLGAH